MPTDGAETTTMGNMAYCRLHNTLADLQQIAEEYALDELGTGVLSDEEEAAGRALLRLMRELVEQYPESDD